MDLPVNKIICGDCSEVLPTLPRAKMIFADPPDNLGMEYNGFTDKRSDYTEWLWDRLWRAWNSTVDILWISYYYKYQPEMLSMIYNYYNWPEPNMFNWRQFIWRFTFGQYNQKDCGNGYRPLLRLTREDAILYPDAIRIPSARQTLCDDKRADPRGRIPDDVWEFPRVCGTFKEKRQWHPNQHPEALIERIVKFSCKPGDLMIDMFAGTGTFNRVCKRLGVGCIGIEISKFYCEKIAEENGIEMGLFEKIQ